MFAPIYRPSKAQQTYLARQDRIQRKRQRLNQDDNQTNLNADEEEEQPQSPDVDRTQTLSKRDPYHVAGHSRSVPLPPAPFPHAAISNSSQSQPSVPATLASLHPPLYLSKTTTRSHRRQHLDVLTTLLHTSLLRRDWTRALRIWTLLLHCTGKDASTPDLRAHGRWAIGAELLLRTAEQPDVEFDDSRNDATLAREYYARLALTHPAPTRPPPPNSLTNANALQFLLASFSLQLHDLQSQTNLDADSLLVEAKRLQMEIDELLLAPPWDSHVAFLALRSMVGLWVTDLQEQNGMKL